MKVRQPPISSNMAKIVILGSANAIPDERHENTHMAVVGQKRTLLIDCVSNPIVRLAQANIDLKKLSDLVLTHFHPDHVSGVPLLLMDMWLLGRRVPLHIYGLDETLDRVEDLMEFYGWAHWPNFYPVTFHRIPAIERAPVLENEDFRVFSSPVKHLIPTIGVRIEFPQSSKAFAYSCDTEPCPQVVGLGTGVDVLIHEAAGASKGHSSPGQAGEVAREAGVSCLYLIHYPTRGFPTEPMLDEARKSFGGPVLLAEDFMEIEL